MILLDDLVSFQWILKEGTIRINFSSLATGASLPLFQQGIHSVRQEPLNQQRDNDQVKTWQKPRREQPQGHTENNNTRTTARRTVGSETTGESGMDVGRFYWYQILGA